MSNQPNGDRWKSLADDLGIPGSQASTEKCGVSETQSMFPPAQNNSPPTPVVGPKQIVSITAKPDDDEFTFRPSGSVAREVEVERTVEVECTQPITSHGPADSQEFSFGNGEGTGNTETQEIEGNGAKDSEGEEGGLEEAPQEEIRTVVFSSPEEAAECESQPPPDPEGDEPVEEIDLNKWSVPPWQEIIDSLYRPER